MSNLDDFKNLADIMQAVATVAAIIVGGIWTYRLFISKRQSYPRAIVTHQITHYLLPDNKVVLRVIVRVSNAGEILLSLISGIVRVHQMLPCAPELQKQFGEDADPIRSAEGATEVDWPLLYERNPDWKKDIKEIEPGEHDDFHFEFILKDDIELVVVYSYLRNQRKVRSWFLRWRRVRDIGWNTTSVYNLHTGKSGGESSNMAKTDNISLPTGTKLVPTPDPSKQGQGGPKRLPSKPQGGPKSLPDTTPSQNPPPKHP